MPDINPPASPKCTWGWWGTARSHKVSRQRRRTTQRVSCYYHFASLHSWKSFFMQIQFFLSFHFSHFLPPDLLFRQEQQGGLTEDPNAGGREPVDPVVHRLAEGQSVNSNWLLGRETLLIAVLRENREARSFTQRKSWWRKCHPVTLY